MESVLTPENHASYDGEYPHLMRPIQTAKIKVQQRDPYFAYIRERNEHGETRRELERVLIKLDQLEQVLERMPAGRNLSDFKLDVPLDAASRHAHQQQQDSDRNFLASYRAPHTNFEEAYATAHLTTDPT